MRKRRSAEEVAQLLSGYGESGLSRQEYCLQLGIPVTTLDYYRQREARKTVAEKRAATLLRVKVEAPAEHGTSVFTLVLRNGRRIESPWKFVEAELARLIRVVEGA
jgi:hypothetical protein